MLSAGSDFTISHSRHVLPVLLYDSENWIVTNSLLKKLEAFQAELVKRALKQPKYLSNTAALLVLKVPSMMTKILERKLSFLQHVMEKGQVLQLSVLSVMVQCTGYTIA